MVKFTVIGGSASKDLAKRLARKLRAVYIETETKIFPDGESKITLRKIPKKSVILVIQSTYPPVDTNLLQALSIISQVKKISSRTFMLQSAGAKKVIVVDIHSNTALNHFNIPTENVSAIPELVKYFKKLNLKNPLVVSPDAGGSSRSKKFASLLKSDFIVLKKHRDRKTGRVSIQTTKVDVQGKDLIIVDDMISTGGSVIKAAQFLKKQKCKRVFVACTHGLLVDDAEKKIRKAGVSRIISTNTIPGNTSKVDVSGILAKSVQ